MATTKKGFRNSDGWTWPRPKLIHRRAPFTSGPRIGTKISSTKKKAAPNSDRSPRPLARHHRNADHHRHAERDPRELAPEIIELGEADVAARIALRRGGRGGGDGDQADRDQHADQQQQDLVDLPEPAAERAGVRAAVAVGIHQRGLGLDLARDALDHNAPTNARNWSPRSSKSRNWSNDAQAGDSSTVSPLSASAAASPTARSSVSHSATAMCGDKSEANNSPASPMV